MLKIDPENDDKHISVFNSRPGMSSQMNRPNGNMGIIRVTSGQSSGSNGGIVVRKPYAAKSVRVRKGSSGSEDDDYGVKKGKDDRVYDR